MRRLALWFCFCLMLWGCSPAQTSVKVLFIGNSCTYVNDLLAMIGYLAAAAGRALESTIASAAPVGLAWQLALRRQPGLGLWVGDGSRIMVAGTYLAACVFCQALCARNPMGNHFTAGLDGKTVALLQQAAVDAATQWKR